MGSLISINSNIEDVLPSRQRWLEGMAEILNDRRKYTKKVINALFVFLSLEMFTRNLILWLVNFLAATAR